MLIRDTYILYSQVASFAVLYVIGELHLLHTVQNTVHQILMIIASATTGVCISLVGTGFLVGFMTQVKKV